MLAAWLARVFSRVALALSSPARADSTEFWAWSTLAFCWTVSDSSDFWAVRSVDSAWSTDVRACATLLAAWVRADASDAIAVFSAFSADCTEFRADVLDWMLLAVPVLVHASAV